MLLIGKKAKDIEFHIGSLKEQIEADEAKKRLVQSATNVVQLLDEMKGDIKAFKADQLACGAAPQERKAQPHKQRLTDGRPPGSS